MKTVAICALILAGSIPAGGVVAAEANLSAEEVLWIRSHPTISFASDARLRPLEYVEKGEFKGLTADYLRFIERKSGLKFEFVPTSSWQDAQARFLAGDVMVLPNVMDGRMESSVAKRALVSHPYLAATSVVFTLPGAPAVLSMEQLAGRTVAARSSGMYAQMVQRTYPSLRVKAMPSPDAALDEVIAGRADAAMGTTLTFQPFMKRKYASELNISRPEISLVMVAQIASAADEPLLASIIEKSLATLTTEEESQIRDKWLKETDYGAPTLGSILEYNAPQAIALALLVALLALFAHRAQLAKRRAVESERVKARFLATMSHEIRTPINAVLGSVEMLMDSPLSTHQQQLAAIAVNGAELLDTLLDNVLDLSRLDEREMRLELVPTNIESLVRKTVSIFRMRAADKGVTLEVEVAGDVEFTFLVDPTRLRQVVTNLVGNAVKFTANGSVLIKASVTGASGKQALLELQVIDSGVGIPPELQTVIFDAYRQADTTTTRKYGGTGLGLSICRELVHLMGGTIGLESQPGKGTAVSIAIPVDKVDTDPAAASAPIHEANVTHIDGRVLVVDDHQDNRFIIAQQLRRIGLEADVTESAELAIAAFTVQQYSLVLMDCHMPDTDGYRATTLIREVEATQGRGHTPIIAISAATDAAHLARCMESGMDGVLKKPLRIEDLRGIATLWLGDASSRSLEAGPFEELTEAQLRARYRQSLMEDLALLESAITGHDERQAAYRSHRLRGAAGMAGDHELAEWAHAVERGGIGPAEISGYISKMRDRLRRWGDAS